MTASTGFKVVGGRNRAPDWASTILALVADAPEIFQALSKIELPAVIPPPPKKLRVPLRTTETLILLDQAYRSVVGRRKGRHVGAIIPVRTERQVMACAHALARFDLAPAAWVSWSCFIWRHVMGKLTSPYVTWVYSASRVERQYEACKRERSHASQRLLTMSAYDMQAKWQRCWDEVWTRDCQTPHDVCAVVRKHWPGDTFQRTLTKVAADTLRQQKFVDKQVNSGTSYK